MTCLATNGVPPKVVGLGAPISVWIYFDVIEIPAVAAAIADELARYSDPRETNGDWADHAHELRSMRADIELASASRVAGRFGVTWPTALAHPVVRDAVAHAQRRLAGASPEDAVAARLALAAAERTRDDFDTVDRGGKEAVWL